MSLYRDKYRRETVRWRQWDYGSNAAYFVTTHAHARIHFFGNIREDVMLLSEIGRIAEKHWLEIPDYFPYVNLGVHVVMPNHVHGVIVIDKSEDFVEQTDFTAEHIKTGGATGNSNPMLHENLARVIRWYKGRVTFESRKINRDFQWQSRFHEHVIRNGHAYQKISDYIIDNPKNWLNDDFFSS